MPGGMSQAKLAGGTDLRLVRLDDLCRSAGHVILMECKRYVVAQKASVLQYLRNMQICGSVRAFVIVWAAIPFPDSSKVQSCSGEIRRVVSIRRKTRCFQKSLRSVSFSARSAHGRSARPR